MIMGIFKNVYCSECGKKTKLLFRTKLTDGNCLCSDCTSAIPSYMRESLALTYSLEDYRALISHIEESKRELRPIFQETHHYYSIHIDTIHNLFYIGDRIDDQTVFHRFRYISNYKFAFHAEEFKEGTFGDKVRGKILFNILMDIPYFHYEEILARNVKVKAKKTFFGSEVQYEDPRDLQEFLAFFDMAFNADKEDFYSIYDSFGESASNTSELQQAMALFMIDDLSDVTINELKEQRNKLIMIFHPDKSPRNDEKYARKINAAYEVLKQNLTT